MPRECAPRVVWLVFAAARRKRASRSQSSTQCARRWGLSSADNARGPRSRRRRRGRQKKTDAQLSPRPPTRERPPRQQRLTKVDLVARRLGAHRVGGGGLDGHVCGRHLALRGRRRVTREQSSRRRVRPDFARRVQRVQCVLSDSSRVWERRGPFVRASVWSRKRALARASSSSSRATA